MKIAIRNNSKALEQSLAKATPQEVTKKLEGVLTPIGERVKNAAKIRAPKKTGALRNAIQSTIKKSPSKGTVKLTIMVGDGPYRGDVFYGFLQEEGFRLGKRPSKKKDEHGRRVKDKRKKVAGKHYLVGAFTDEGAPAVDKAIDAFADHLINEAFQ